MLARQTRPVSIEMLGAFGPRPYGQRGTITEQLNQSREPDQSPSTSLSQGSVFSRLARSETSAFQPSRSCSVEAPGRAPLPRVKIAGEFQTR